MVNEHPALTEATVHISGPGAESPEPLRIDGLTPGAERTVEVPVEIAAPYQPGSIRRVTVTVTGTDRRTAARSRAQAEITVAEPGWTMWMVSHFHYDPVWWNTQGQFTEARLVLPDEDGKLPDVRTAFELVRLHLAKARDDPDYKFVLAEIDYLKPYFDVYPEERADLRRLIEAGRLEIVGGNYNEPNTNLTSAESTIRNAVYGIGYQRDVIGGDPRTAWMLDVFGHDPGYPGLMAAAGLTSSAWARGPFHQWGPAGAEDGGVGRMQFPSEFEWLSPDGNGLLTAYMAHHYGAGWALHTPPDLETAERKAYEQFSGLSRVAATRNVLLPVGSDHVIPARWVTDIHRSWNQRYVWPRFVTAVPSEFFAAVRRDAGDRDVWITPQTRDMNPVYTGKDVSCIDTKQAQRAIEIVVTEAERLSTLAALAGAPYPHASLDKVWRILAFCAHHDGITGVESDQVYLDLVGAWREAWELAVAARRAALCKLSTHDTGGSRVGAGTEPPARRLAVWNAIPRTRDSIATITFPHDGTEWPALRDAEGRPVPALAAAACRRDDGSLAEVTLSFRATDVPGLGHRSYAVTSQPTSGAAEIWSEIEGLTIENDAFSVTADPARGGTVRLVDKRTGLDTLRGPGNELLLQEEYAQHPRHGEGPWHLSPRGAGLGSAAVPAHVRAERCPIGSRLVATFGLGDLAVTQETVLWDGAERVEFRTHVDGSIGSDHLLRVRFPADVPGGLPVYQTATAVIGRPFGAVDVDSADTWYTLDNPALGWFGLGSTARVRSGVGRLSAIGVAEVINAYYHNGTGTSPRDLLIALAGAGVTATCSSAQGSRYGAIDADSNLPDVRIALGGPDLNAFSSAVLAAADPEYAASLDAQLAASGTARVWVPATRSRARAFAPNADLRGVRDLPVLIIAGADPDQLATEIQALIEDLADAVVEVPSVALAGGTEPTGGDSEPTGNAGNDATVDPGPTVSTWDDATADAVLADDHMPGEEMLADRSVAILNRGTPGCVVTPDGTLHLNLMRACSAWPTGIWIDGERRTTPDGSAFSLQHWTHTFEYALVSGPGDWRTAGFNAAAEDYAHDLLTISPTGPALTPADSYPVGSGTAPADSGAARMAGPGADSDAARTDGPPADSGTTPAHESGATVTDGSPAGPGPSSANRAPAGPGVAKMADPGADSDAARTDGPPADSGTTPAHESGATVTDGSAAGSGPPPADRTPAGSGAASGASSPGGPGMALADGDSLVSVEPATVTLTALKPRGNPLASGRAPAGPVGDGGFVVTARLRETTGRPATARIRLASGISSAWLTDLLEETDLEPLPVVDGVALVDIQPFGTATIALRVTMASSPASTAAAFAAPHSGGPGPEPVQPIYSRYWLHEKGPAPTGNLPVAVHLSPTRLALNADAASDAVRLTVACGPAGATGEAELIIPAELEVTGADGPLPYDGADGRLRYDLGPGAHAAWDLTVRARPGVADGRYFLAARIVSESGFTIEDAAMVAVGEKHWPDRDLPPEEAMERMLADYTASAGEVELDLLTSSVELAPGEHGVLAVRLTSHLASELRGEIQLVSPWGSWELTGSTIQPVTLAPGASTDLRYLLQAPATARPGAHWWALVKLMYFGRVWYTDSAPITITPAARK